MPTMGINDNTNVISEVVMGTNTKTHSEPINTMGRIISTVDVSTEDVTVDVSSKVVTGTNTTTDVEPKNMIGRNISSVKVSSALPGFHVNNTNVPMTGKNDNTYILIEVVTGTNTTTHEKPINLIGGNISTMDVSSEDVTTDVSGKVVTGTNTTNQIELNVNVCDNIDITRTMDINDISSAVLDTEPYIDITKGNNQAITLTNLCKAVIQSIQIVPSLKDCCHLSMSRREPTFNINTKSGSEHTNIDHSYCLGYKHNSNRKSHDADDLVLDSIGIMDNPLFSNTTDSAEDTNVVIESMVADIPVCVDDTSHNHQTDLFAALEDDQTQLMHTSDDSFSSVKYDPTGTELILPLKKRKLILRNPEKTVTELWKQNVLS